MIKNKQYLICNRKTYNIRKIKKLYLLIVKELGFSGVIYTDDAFKALKTSFDEYNKIAGR